MSEVWNSYCDCLWLLTLRWCGITIVAQKKDQKHISNIR